MRVGTASAKTRPGIFLVIHGAGWGGTERHVRGLMLGLAARGETVHLVVSQEGPLLDEARASGISTHVVMRKSTVSYISYLKQCLGSLRPAIVHAHSGRIPCLAARLAGVPGIVETRHGLPERSSRLYRSLPASRRWEGWKCKARPSHRRRLRS